MEGLVMTNYDITTIESSFASAIKTGGVSSTVLTSRPKAMTQVNDFVVVKVGSSVVDMGTYATSKVDVCLFAKDVAAEKNAKKLSVMYSKLLACVKALEGKCLVDMHPVISSDIGDDYGFHSRIVIFTITIKRQ